MTDMILRNGRITTLDPKTPDATAMSIKDGRIAAVGSDHAIMSGADGGLDPFMGVADDPLRTAEAAADKIAQEFGPEG